MQPAYTTAECTALGKRADPPRDLTDHCYLALVAAAPMRSVERVALLHYAVKSKADFRAKMARGSSMGGRAKGRDYFRAVSSCAPSLRPPCAGVCVVTLSVPFAAHPARRAEPAPCGHTLHA